MRLRKAEYGNLRITFEGDDWSTFVLVCDGCMRDSFSYPTDYHDERPYGANLQEPYISVTLCDVPYVLRRIKTFMAHLERAYGMTVDDDVRALMDGWAEYEPPEPPKKQAPEQTPAAGLKQDYPYKCTGCKYRHMNNGTDCKLFLLMGEAACE